MLTIQQGDDTAKKFLDNCMSHFISKFEKKLQEFDPIIEGAISKPESVSLLYLIGSISFNY